MQYKVFLITNGVYKENRLLVKSLILLEDKDF